VNRTSSFLSLFVFQKKCILCVFYGIGYGFSRCIYIIKGTKYYPRGVSNVFDAFELDSLYGFSINPFVRRYDYVQYRIIV
jgi:hypothetical protein